MKHKIKNWLYQHKPTKTQIERLEVSIAAVLLLIMIVYSLHLALQDLTK